MRRLTKKEVIEICKDLNAGAFIDDLAYVYDVSESTISRIANKKAHRAIGEKYLKARVKNNVGVRAVNSAFTTRQVRAIRKLAKSKGYYKLVQKRVAEKYYVSTSTISDLINYKTYKNV